MENFAEKLESYARLTIEIGVNLQKGQHLVVNAPVNTKEFVREVVRAAYDAGAGFVHVEWEDETVGLVKYRYAPDEAFKIFPCWKARGFEELVEKGTAFMHITAADPDLLAGIDPKKIALQNKTDAEGMAKYLKLVLGGKVNWGIYSVPTPGWSARVFPGLPEKERMDKLWETLFKVVRVDTADPARAWRKHLKGLKGRIAALNRKRYKKLHYRAPGTNLTAELPPNHLWRSGMLKNNDGVEFVPNMPSEEVFTMPIKHGVNGTVRATRPLSHRGSLITGMTMTFKDGKIVGFSADKGYGVLKGLLDTDEGSRYLGEVALVPQDSPVTQTGLLFYNTLFDENTSSHLAFGFSYVLNVEGGTQMSQEEFVKNGGNVSVIHVDFMIGSPELDIDGETRDGKIEPVFRKGNWTNPL